MRFNALLFLLLFIGIANGQTFQYPTIHEHTKKDSLFVPKGWTLIQSAKGDLNRDGIDDIAFVIQNKDSVKLVNHDYNVNDTITTQPRILVIAIYDIIQKNYKPVVQSNTFILNHDNPYRDDPFDGIEISNSVLTIHFHIWYNQGTYETTKSAYKFRFQNNAFELIGVDKYSLHRATGAIESRSYNFMTGRAKIEKGNMAIDDKTTIWKKFKVGDLKTFETFKEPFTFEIEPDYHL